MSFSNGDTLEHIYINNVTDHGFKGDGITNGLVVTEDSPLGMKVDVAVGTCFIAGVEQKETSITNLTITAADVTNPRKDIIVYDDSANNPIVVTGLAAPVPVIPSLVSDQILLAIVDVIANETEITNSEIKDCRCFVVTIPKGIIMMWQGAEATIPTGWYICDGTNSTPDLRDRFIVGAGSTYSVDDTGGSTTHRHIDNEGISADDVEDGVHGTDTQNHLPPYYALYYIMKG